MNIIFNIFHLYLNIFPMLSVSDNEIVFKTGEMIKTMMIKNLSKELSLIFKIRTNKIDHVDSKPNMGIVPKQKAVQLIVKALKGSSFEAKLQISYAVLQQEVNITGSNSLSAQWTKIPKEKTHSIVVTVKKEQSFESESQERVSQQFLTSRTEQKKQQPNFVIEPQKKLENFQAKPQQVFSKQKNRETFKSMAEPSIQQHKQKLIQQKKELVSQAFKKPQNQFEVIYNKPKQNKKQAKKQEKKEQIKPKQLPPNQTVDSPSTIKISIFKLIGLFLLIFVIGHLHGRNSAVCIPEQIPQIKANSSKNSNEM